MNYHSFCFVSFVIVRYETIYNGLLRTITLLSQWLRGLYLFLYLPMLQTEFEIKFFVADRDALIEKIKALWWIQKYPERLMRRMNFDHIGGYTGKEFVRIRDEGNKVTCTYKSLQNDISQIDCVSEREVVVSSFDDMIAIFQWLGMEYRNYQETRREKWVLSTASWEVDFCLDTRPWVPEFLEIEGPDQQIVEEIAIKLWFMVEEGMFGFADSIYEKAGVCSCDEINHWKDLRFDNYPTKK